jgi:hypothetical protein
LGGNAGSKQQLENGIEREREREGEGAATEKVGAFGKKGN